MLIPQARLWPLTVAQYDLIGSLGIIHEDEPVELLEGLLVRKGEYFPEYRDLHFTRQGDGSWLIPIEKLYPLSVEQYHQLADAGILKDGDPVELLEGRLFRKMTKNRRHSFVTQELLELLRSQLPAGWFLETQEPIVLPSGEPEPDLTLLRGTRQQFRAQKPSAADVHLVVEVSDSTLPDDKKLKLPTYAAASIAHYWIVNLIDNRIEWYADPTGGIESNATYRQRVDYPLGSTLVFPLDGKELRVVVDDQLIPTE